jgi:hypothetical protein
VWHRDGHVTFEERSVGSRGAPTAIVRQEFRTPSITRR